MSGLATYISLHVASLHTSCTGEIEVEVIPILFATLGLPRLLPQPRSGWAFLRVLPLNWHEKTPVRKLFDIFSAKSTPAASDACYSIALEQQQNTDIRRTVWSCTPTIHIHYPKLILNIWLCVPHGRVRVRADLNADNAGTLSQKGAPHVCPRLPCLIHSSHTAGAVELTCETYLSMGTRRQPIFSLGCCDGVIYANRENPSKHWMSIRVLHVNGTKTQPTCPAECAARMSNDHIIPCISPAPHICISIFTHAHRQSLIRYIYSTPNSISHIRCEYPHSTGRQTSAEIKTDTHRLLCGRCGLFYVGVLSPRWFGRDLCLRGAVVHSSSSMDVRFIGVIRSPSSDEIGFEHLLQHSSFNAPNGVDIHWDRLLCA